MRPSRLIGRNVTGVHGDAANLDDLDRLFDIGEAGKGQDRRPVRECRHRRARSAGRDHRASTSIRPST